MIADSTNEVENGRSLTRSQDAKSREEQNMMHGTVKDTMKAVRDVGSDDILAALGLERRRNVLDYVLPAVSYFAVGLAVGAGVTLLVAPKTGRQMRRELSEKVRNAGSQLSTAAEHVLHDAQDHLGNESGRARGDESSPVKRTGGPSISAKS
jgi:hypothetical protein